MGQNLRLCLIMHTVSTMSPLRNESWWFLIRKEMYRNSGSAAVKLVQGSISPVGFCAQLKIEVVFCG